MIKNDSKSLKNDLICMIMYLKKYISDPSQGKTVYDLKGCPHVDFTYGNHMWTPHVDTKTTCGPSYTMITYEVYI